MYEFCKAEIVYRVKFRCNKIFIYKYVPILLLLKTNIDLKPYKYLFQKHPTRKLDIFFKYDIHLKQMLARM